MICKIKSTGLQACLWTFQRMPNFRFHSPKLDAAALNHACENWSEIVQLQTFTIQHPPPASGSLSQNDKDGVFSHILATRTRWAPSNASSSSRGVSSCWKLRIYKTSPTTNPRFLCRSPDFSRARGCMMRLNLWDVHEQKSNVYIYKMRISNIINLF